MKICENLLCGTFDLLIGGQFDAYEHPTQVDRNLIRYGKILMMNAISLSEQPFHAVAVHGMAEALFRHQKGDPTGGLFWRFLDAEKAFYGKAEHTIALMHSVFNLL